MPNWCENTLNVSVENNNSESKEQLEKFIKKAKRQRGEDRTALSLNKLYRMPKKYTEGEGWWNWCVSHWGTKWDVKAEISEQGERYIEYFFDSAWSPPTDWLKKVAKDYPKLHFDLEYAEYGIAFAGEMICTGGEVVENESHYMSQEEIIDRELGDKEDFEPNSINNKMGGD